jgi:hypothetical protein
VKRLAVALVLAWCGIAAADVPWANGVSKENQAKANALFAEANQLFAEQAHAPALERYRAAVALWDHPLIEFNMAVTLIRLDRFLEAAETIDRALRFGAEPYPTPEQFRQALDYQKLIAGRVATIEATCTQAGVSVLLDGKPWLSCPGAQKRRVLAGEHVIVGEKSGYITLTRRLVVAGGVTTRERIALVSLDAAVTLEYPAPRWLPWTATGAGAAVALGGLAFWLAGNRQMDRFEEDFDMLCPNGCSGTLDANPTERQLGEQRDAARFKGDVGIVMMASGGAIVIGGVVWTLLNRPRRVLPRVEVAPTAGGVAARASISF